MGKGYRFSYVGDRERTKQGLGVVVTGTEEVRMGVGPWRLFAVEEKRTFAGLLNRHLFASAEEFLTRAVLHTAEERDLPGALIRLARVYRALELAGQSAFEEAFGCHTGAADPARLPEALREEYAARYAGRSGAGLQLRLMAVFRALEAAGRTEGLAFASRRAGLEKLLYARNHSILAHGFEAATPDPPERFEALVREALGAGT